MSAIGDYVYFTWADYKDGVRPPKIYNNASRLQDAKAVFNKKKQKILSYIKTKQDFRSAETREHYLNLTSQILEGKTDDFDIDDQKFADDFKKIFEDNMKQAGFSTATYNYIGKDDDGFSGFYQQNAQLQKQFTDIIKDDRKTGLQWKKQLKELQKILKTGIGATYVKGAMGIGDADFNKYQQQLNSIIFLLDKLKDIAVANEDEIREIIQSSEIKSRSGAKVNEAQMQSLIKWLKEASKPGNKVMFQYGSSNGINYDDNILTGLRYLGHVFFHPSKYAKAKITEIINASAEQTAAGLALLEFDNAIIKEVNASGTKTGINMIRKSDLTTKLADKLYKEGKVLNEVEIDGITWIKTSQSQNKMDTSIIYEVFNDDFASTELTLGNSVKKTENDKSSLVIKGLTGGNLYNLIGNDNDNLFLTHYINIFAVKSDRWNLTPDVGNVASDIKNDGDIAMQLIFAYRGFTGNGIPKFNVELDYNGDTIYKPVGGATMLDLYDATTKKWTVRTMNYMLQRLWEEDNHTLKKLSIHFSGAGADNNTLYPSNFFPINKQPYIPENMADIGTIRRRINATIDYIHNTNISIAINSARKLMGIKK